MSTRSPIFLLYAAILSIGGVAGGWAITSQLAGSSAGLSFLQFGGLVALMIFVVLTVLYKKAARRVIYLILFNIMLFVDMIWFTSCVFLPIFWMQSIDIGVRLGIFVFAVGLYWINIVKGMRGFEIKWMSVERDLMRRYYHRKNQVLDWDGVARSLKLVVSLYIAGVPEKLNPILYIASIGSMLLGFSLRNVFPICSVFAWGIPVIIINSIFLQMIGFGISQIYILSAMEKKESVELRPA